MTIEIINRHFPELVMAREGRKENAETINRKRLCMVLTGKHHSVCDCIHQNAWQGWENFLCATRHNGTTPKKSVAKLEPELKTWSPKQNTKANSCKTVQKKTREPVH